MIIRFLRRSPTENRTWRRRYNQWREFSWAGKQYFSFNVIPTQTCCSSLDVHSPYTSFYGRNPLKRDTVSTESLFHIVWNCFLCSRSFPGHSRTTLSSPSIPSWQLKTEIAEDEDEQDLDTEVKTADTPDLTKTHSSNVSSSSEIEMINETSGEENQ